MKKVTVVMTIGVIFTLMAFNLSYAQDELTVIGSLEGEFERAWGLAFSEDGGFAYVPDKGPEEGPIVHIINITDPANPTSMTPIQITSDKTREGWGVKVVGDFLYVAAFKAGLYIYDIGNPMAPVFVGSFYVEDGSESRGVFVKDGIAFIADAWKGLRIVDVSTPQSPTELALYNTSSDLLSADAEFHDVKVVGNFAYCAAGDQGIVIVDVSTPDSPAGVGSCCDKATIGEGSWGRGIDVCGNYAYLSDNQAGLRIADISNPAAPYEVGFFVFGGELWKVKAAGNSVFVPYSGKFFVLDVSDPANPIELANGTLVSSGQAVLIKEDYAYIVTGSSLLIFDVGTYLAVDDHGNHERLPSDFILRQNYPNPFNPGTTIEYELAKSDWVNLKIYDITGKEVANLVNAEMGAGLHRIYWSSDGLTAGIYCYTISVNGITQTKKLVLLK